MAANSKIQWTTHTMNFWVGCQKVSPACDNCYAESWAKRAGRDFEERRRTSEAAWKQPIRWNAEAQKGGTRAAVFTNSLADFWDNQADRAMREEACLIMEKCTELNWQVLSKRPQNAVKMAPSGWLEHWPPHIWFGASAGTRPELERNLRHVLAIPAPIRFLSLEPLLEDLGEIDLTGISWVIIGGESGPRARPYCYEWAQQIIDECRAADVACFHKQVGSHPVGFDGRRVHLRDKKGGDPELWPESLRVREMPEESR